MTFVVTEPLLGQKAKPNADLEQTIRKLEHEETEAVLRSDIPALEKMWAEDFTVNNPQNQISRGRKEVFDRVRAGLINYSAFVRQVEEIKFYGDTVIVMGSEVVTPAQGSARAGQTIRRRFTNIWMKRKGKWWLTARHASIICEN
jgi:ketosteroid isomerase-like protein